MASANLDDMRDASGKLPAYSWPGCYPLLYLTRDCLVVCASCANKETSDPAVVADVNWENADLFCDDCSTRIPSAYAEDDNV